MAARHDSEFKDITQDAATLRVSRAHLWRVLTGKRPGRSLKLRYNKLQVFKATKPATTQPWQLCF